MQRTVVYRFDGTERINVNDEIGLDALASYTLKEHLEDLAGEGLSLIASNGLLHVFTGYVFQFLQQRSEHIRFATLDEDSKLLVLCSIGLRYSQAQARGAMALLPCC